MRIYFLACWCALVACNTSSDGDGADPEARLDGQALAAKMAVDDGANLILTQLEAMPSSCEPSHVEETLETARNVVRDHVLAGRTAIDTARATGESSAIDAARFGVETALKTLDEGLRTELSCPPE